MPRKSIADTITVGEYFAQVLNRREHSPLIRASGLRDFRQHFVRYILPLFANDRLADITVGDLKVLRDTLLATVSVKTARNIMDGSFRSLWREAMEEGWYDRNPFMALRWPAVRRAAPDPFTEAEKSAILAFTRDHKPFDYPFVFDMFD